MEADHPGNGVLIARLSTVGALQAAGAEVVEELAPGRGALPAHVPDEDLLAVAAYPDGGQHGDVRGLPVQPRADHRGVEDQTDDVLPGEAAAAPRIPVDLHLAPRPADDVLADRALEQAEQRALHRARVLVPAR